MPIKRKKTYARAGLIGNPSDGYGGKTISVPVRNFRAKVQIWPRPGKLIIPVDKHRFKSMKDLFKYTEANGFYDAGRLVKAAAHKFFQYVVQQIKEGELDESIIDSIEKTNFGMKYKTNIPRMVGLAGSSAIITATINCLQEFYGVQIKPETLANLVLSAETDNLGIQAGLQDRVVQAFDDLVFMDFSSEAFERNNSQYGDYEILDKDEFPLPNLFLIYNLKPSESGKIHSNVKNRFKDSNSEISGPVKEAMQEFARLTDEFKKALLFKDYEKCMDLQNENFDRRRELYGDDVIGEENIEMVEIPRSFDCSSKFSGSGGAVIGIYQSESQYQAIKKRVKGTKYEVIRVRT